MRFTPTYVGNTGSSSTFQTLMSVHPHIRGEYLHRHRGHNDCNGSPPHTWGILQTPLPSGRLHRFTPTYVGNTQQRHHTGRDHTVHPHIRGEYRGCKCHKTTSLGSPPHTWGIRCSPAAPGRMNRFTPTYVGNTNAPKKIKDVNTVHPHIRGEYMRFDRFVPCRSGSPPHTWGIP